MTIQNPPLWIDGGSYTPELDRTLLRGIWAKPGIVGPSDLLVRQTTVAGLSLVVDGGLIVLKGTTGTYQGLYLCENRGEQQIGPLAPGDGTNPRKDRIIARIDETSNDWDVEVVQGTPNPVPAEPSLPADSFELALLDVPAGDSTFTGSQITDRRWLAGKGLANMRGAPIITTGGWLPTSADMALVKGQTAFDQSANRHYTWNGANWIGSAVYDTLPTLFYEFGPVDNLVGTGFTTGLAVASAIVAPYPVRMHVEASGNCGFGASGINRILMRIVDHAVTTIYSKGNNLGAGSPGEIAFDIGSTNYDSWQMVGYADFTTGQACSFKIQHSCQTGSNVYMGGVAKVTFEPRFS